MHKRLSYLTIVPLVLPLLAPSAALAQAKDEAKPPSAASGRQAIINKLERIRLETVAYDGLPLGEVVSILRDEVRKRDPDKKGINFLINQNLEPGEAMPAPAPKLGPDGNPLPTPPPEQVDVSAISVTIRPPLNDVRLADVLNAVVRVADRPIKYSVEDYGVVFSPRSSDSAPKDEVPPPSAAGSGGQAIKDKLERIRLDTISYDGLPLGEVVINLKDEARKRDPEKKGINFLLNQNLDPGEAIPTPGPRLGPDGTPLPAPAPEQVDLSAVSVRIKPPLNDVRLLDVLNVVVKVADRPIKYSLEDYGVVFSPRGLEAGHQPDVVAFSFPGGTPVQFLEAVQQQYNADWASVVDIPKEMADVRIPRLRIDREGLMALGHGTDVGTESLGAVISLYNKLGEQKPELGRLIVQGGLMKPSAVMFVPDKALTDTQTKVKVKAFSLYGINDAERAKLEEDIDRARKEATEYASRLRGSTSRRGLEGTVAIHNETSLLVATGPEPFVDMVESIVTAWQAKGRARNPGAPTALPNKPEK
jgi:hypothetical protein